MIAAIYVILSLLSGVLGLQSTPFRVAEALCVLPYFTPAAVPGLFVGCLVSNLTLGGALPDIIFGSLATLLGAAVARLISDARLGRWLVALPNVLANVLILPPVLALCYGYGGGIFIIGAWIALGEVISCVGMGYVLMWALMPFKGRLFKEL